MKKSKFIFVGLILALILTLVAGPLTVSAKPAATLLTPQLAGSTGLKAAYIAKPGENISNITISPDTVNGSYAIGIYVGVGNVMVNNVEVSGATIGILVQDTSNAVIKNSEIFGNASKGIILAGTSDCLVQNNDVYGNNGGINIYDDGPVESFNLTVHSSPLTPSMGNTIKHNNIVDNSPKGVCAITLAAFNGGTGAGLWNNVVSDNDVEGSAAGIVLGVGEPSGTTATNTIIDHNLVNGGAARSVLVGIAIHNFGGAISNTQISHNNLSNNGIGLLSTATTGIEIGAVPGGNTGTQVTHNTISNDYFGVFIVPGSDTSTQIDKNTYNSVTITVGS